MFLVHIILGATVSAMEVDTSVDAGAPVVGGDGTNGDPSAAGGAGNDGSFGDPNEYYESEQFYEDLTNAARRAKAEEVLFEWKEQAEANGDDVSFYERHMADLEKFVQDNKDDLDRLLHEQDNNDDGNNSNKNKGKKAGKKRGHGEGEEKDEEELEDKETAGPALKK